MKILDTAREPHELLHVSHETLYRYSAPVGFTPHRLVLRPREGHDLHLESMDLETSPVSVIRWYRDVLDNIIAIAEFSEPATELRILNQFVITVLPADPAPPATIPVPYPPHVPGIDELGTAPYRQFTWPAEVGTLRKWFADAGCDAVAGELNPIFDNLAKVIRSHITYRRRDETGVQSPVETLEIGSGSCRDMAVLMIEASRAIGFPARFVSGYLEGENSRNGRGSTHAWAEIYLPGLGWAGFDPSVGGQTGPKHIPVGVSYHPRGVMPVSGGYSGPAGTTCELRVRIETRRESVSP